MIGMHTALVLLGLFSSFAITDSAKVKRIRSGKVYEDHEDVHIVVNKVGPFNNPTETYRYYSLPFCQKHSTEEEEQKAIADSMVSGASVSRRETEKREGAKK